MPVAKLTSRGQITLPEEVRVDLGVVAGDQVEFVEVAPGRYELMVAPRSAAALREAFGRPSRTVSVGTGNGVAAQPSSDVGK